AFCRSVASGVSHESIGHAAWKRLTLQSTREQFAQCLTDKEIERITDAALEYAIRPADRKRDDKRLWEPSDGEDALQLHRAAASAGYFRPPPQETATGQDRTDLIDEAVEAVTQAPVLLDLAEALREWDVIYGALGMGLPEFLRSRECTLALRKKLKDGCLMELNHGTFVRLPMPEECETGNMAAAMKAGDGRALTAIVVARLVREQARAPVGLMTETIADGYLFIANPEDFVLQAVAALPRQVVKVAKLALDIIASGYLRLERSRVTLVGAAFSPENSRCLDAQIALKSLGHHFGIDEWKERSWQSVKTTAIAATGPARHLTDFEEAIPEDAFKDGGKKEDQKEVIAVASFPKVAGDLKTNEELCWRIAAMKKVDYNDVDLAKRVWVKEPEDEGIRALQSTVQGAVKRLSEDLYSGEAHFLLELLQNVDDCQYPEGEKPTLQLTYESRKDHFADFTSFKTSSRVNGLLVVEHNEAGFQENNVVAICDIDKSTKKAREKRFIGAKGIGFKSVFLVTATPVIHSGRFHFHFDADALNGLGSLLPFPLTPVTPVSRQTGTQLVLPLSSSEGPLKKRGLRASDVATRALQDMRPTLLLFLQKLECVQAIDRNSGRTRTMTKEVLEAEVGGAPCQEIKLKSEELSDVQEVIEERWLVYTKPVQLEGEAITELKLAFRLDKPAGVEQAYAWLPLRSYGLRFLIQADWRVPSSREAITEAVFNQKIRDQVPNAYGEAAKIFAAAALKAAGLEDANAAGTAWSQLEDCIEAARDALVPLYTSIPRQGDATDFFQETDGKILRAVMDVAVVLVRVPCPGAKEGSHLGSDLEDEDLSEQETQWRLELVTPRRAVRAELPEGVPASLSHLQQPIDILLAQADRYVEVGGMPARAAEGLRVPVLDANIALDCLKAMGRLHTQKVADQGSASLTDGDIEVLQLLLLIVAMAATKKRQLTEDVRNLQIVPTDGGKLVCLTAEEARGFKVYDVPPDMVGIEALLGAAGQRLDPRLSQKARPEVREFLVQLGVEQVDGSAFFTNVLLPVLTQSEASEAEKLILATRQFKDLLGICDQDRKDSLIETLSASDAGWWVLASSGTSECKAVKVGGKTRAGLHVSPLPGKLVDKVVGVDWLAPSSAYYGEEAAESEEASSWEAFWMLLGAAPVFQVEELQEDFRSEELVRLLAASSTPHLAGEVVALLAPHGEYYSQFLWKPGSQNEPSEIAQLLCKQPWLPTTRGEVVPMNLAWLPEKHEEVEERFNFDASVSPFAQAWPALGIETSPSPSTLIAIVEHLRSQEHLLQLTIAEMASLYGRMGGPSAGGGPAWRGGGAGGGACAAFDGRFCEERFLEEEKWVFVPNHPRPHKDFDTWFNKCPKMQHSGNFYDVKQLVFCDRAECLDGFAGRASDDMIDLMRQCLDKRVVANYYFGQRTLWPHSWRRRGGRSEAAGGCVLGARSNLHELLGRYGIQEELGVSDYICVFKAIDQQIEKGKSSGVTGFVGQMLSRIALRVKNEIEEEQHRREEDANDWNENPQEFTETSESLEMIRDGLSDVRFIQAADGTWQPLKRYQFVLSGPPESQKAMMKGWPSDALRFVADPPKGVNPESRRSVVDLMRRLGMRDSPTLLKRASFVPLEATGGFDFLRKDWAKAIRVIRDSSERLKDDRSSWALFEEIERVVEDALRIEEVQKLSLDQVLVIDGDRAKEADVDTLDAYKGMPRSLLEFKPHGGSAVPIARIKALFAEPFFIGHEDGKLFLAFLPGQLVMNNISEKLAKAFLWIAVKKLSPEDQAQFRQSDYGFTNKARTFVGQLRMAIQATKAETGV
ncbi:Protein NO VEIN (Protein EMBRYO DEFECTIVE 2597), partial [Durusdinium trenchii]